MVQCLRPILQNLGLQVSGAPTPIYDYSSPNIDYIKANHITIRVKHIHGHIHYFYERYVLLTIDPIKLKATIQPEGIGNKISTGPLLERQYSYIRGDCYYPPPPPLI